MTTTTLKLDLGPNPAEVFSFGPPTHPPATPGEWFARRYPAVVKEWGAPVLEAVVVNNQQGNRLVKPVEMNDDFFAATISDPQLGHSVVFYQPEQQWYFFDPVDQLYHQTTEEKLVALLSSLISRCAAEMPKNVDTIQLFCRFRSEERLKAVVKRARAINAADSTFFDAESGNKRAGGVESFSDLARGFVRSTVKRQPDRCLSVGECFERFHEYCRNNDAVGISKQQFRQLIVEVIKEEFGLGFRTDLKDEAGTWMERACG